MSVDTGYTDGQYGWLTVSEKEDSEHGSEVPQPYGDSILGKDDAVFRVALPNGTYEVICYFSNLPVSPLIRGADESESAELLEINLIANGERQIQQLQIPAGNETIEKRYNITITDGHLTQVIYTDGKRWGWSGFTIQLNSPPLRQN